MNTLKKYLPAALLTLTMVVVMTTSVAHASPAESIFGKDCGLRVMPHNPDGRIPAEGDIPGFITFGLSGLPAKCDTLSFTVSDDAV